jgi:hypothetical protein
MNTQDHVMLGHVLVRGIKRQLQEYNELCPEAKRHKAKHRTDVIMNSMHDHEIPFPVIETPNFSLPLENHASSKGANFEV